MPKCRVCCKIFRKMFKAKFGRRFSKSDRAMLPVHSGPNKTCEKHLVEGSVQGAKRRCSVIGATPTWADTSKIQAVYRECARLTRETGRKHHVDHIVPLRGKKVSGLHVDYNLRPILKLDNMKKGNRFDQDPDDDGRPPA